MMEKVKTEIHLLDNDALSVRGHAEGVGFPSGRQMGFLVRLISPSVDAAGASQLASSVDTTGSGSQKCKEMSAAEQGYPPDIIRDAFGR